MKTVKIILSLVAIATIGFFIWKWVIFIDDPEIITPPINQFTVRIKSEIESLKKMPANIFCPKLYNDIQYLINDYYQNEFLSENAIDNNTWREILSSNLYSAYAEKFVEQAIFVFSRSQWENDDLNFIRSEFVSLQSSPFLDLTGPVASSFSSIKTILAKYDEITSFIFTCNSFSYSQDGLDKIFPDVSAKIKKSRAYLANNLDNQYVNNCAQLKNELKEIPKNLFYKKVRYLHSKISRHGDRYTEFNYQSDYSKTIYTPLKNQIDHLNNDIYGIKDTDFNNGYNSLDNLLSMHNRNATDYFLKIMEKENEVKDFITSCNNFSYSDYGINKSFPNLNDKIQQSRAYLLNNLKNKYLDIVFSNNNQLKTELNDIPKKLFDKHVSYLNRKIKELAGKFTNYETHSEYLSLINSPLSNQIAALNKNIYGVPRTTLLIEYDNLNKLLNEFNDEASIYYANPRRWLRQNRKERK